MSRGREQHQALETGAAPDIQIASASGMLRIKGWDRPSVEIDAEDNALLEEIPGGVSVTSAGRCRLRVPHDARVSVASLRGDLRIKGVHGPIVIDRVAADLELVDTGLVEVRQVGAQLDVRAAFGPLHVHQVGGHTRIQAVDGPVQLGHVGGHLHAQDVRGGITAHCGGNAEVSLGPGTLPPSRVRAEGNLLVALADDADARLLIESGAGRIAVEERGGRHDHAQRQLRITFGSGGPEHHMRAGGIVRIHHGGVEAGTMHGATWGEGFAAMAEELAAQVESRMQDWQVELEAHFSDLATSLPEALSRAGLSWMESEQLTARVRAAGERAAERARREAVHAARRAEQRSVRQQAAAVRRAERRGQPAPVVAEAPREPVGASDDERAAVLRLLAAGTISAGQADALLAALEGRAPNAAAH